jgi:hypothetical protein
MEFNNHDGELEPQLYHFWGIGDGWVSFTLLGCNKAGFHQQLVQFFSNWDCGVLKKCLQSIKEVLVPQVLVLGPNVLSHLVLFL